MQGDILGPAELAFVGAARRAVLATVRSDGRPRLVPICFVLAADRAGDRLPVLYSAIDDKPKLERDPRRLGRVRDLLARPSTVVLVDYWDEDWSRLAWVRLDGRAELLEMADEAGEADEADRADDAERPDDADRANDADLPDERAAAIALLRAKYPQYASHDLERQPIVRITVDRASSWGDLGSDLGPDHS
ncbi:MAG TPA: TIGR03668 family PPOX class F420-dependent oxidoreductase [Candidatus Limnocylindrales bacterium]